MTSYKFISPNGDIVKGKNLRKFCAENALDYRHMRRLLDGTYASNSGWFTFHKKSQARLQQEKQKLHNINTGETAVLGNSYRAFAEKHGLYHLTLGRLLRGDRKVYKGWVTDKTYKIIYGTILD